MAEEKLGTLEYEMLISQKKLEDQLEEITRKLKEEDKKWKEILSGSGTIASPKIDVANIDKLTKANKQIVLSNDQIASSIEKLKVQLAENVANYEKLTAEQRDNEKVGGKLLATIQQQKDQLDQYNKILRENITARKQAAQEAINQAKSEESAKRSLEAQRSKAFVKSNLDEEKRITQEIKNQESALRALEAQRSKAFVKGELQKERELTAEIKKQESALRSLEAQRSKAFVSQKNKELREQIALEKQAAQEQKLRFAIESQQTGSVARLRAEIALYTFQLGQIKKITPETTAEIRRLNAAINANKQEIAALQPTLGFWGKLSSAIRTYVTAYLSVQGAMAIGRAVYNQTKELDALSFSMQTVIKSSVELAQTQKFLSDVAINYGGDLLTLSERYVKFRAAAIQANMSAAETQKIYDSVSKAAGTLGLKTDELSGVYLALEQMISKGKVTTEELRRQLGERLPGAFGIMANALGKTIPELDKMLKKGEILSSDALPKFAAALEKAYGLEAVDKIDTLAAAQGRLSTQFTELIRSAQASDTFKSAIDSIASFVGFVRDNIGAIKLFAEVLTSLAAVWALNKVRVVALMAVQYTSIIFTGRQIASINALTAAQVRSAESVWLMVRSWQAFKAAVNWVSLLVTVIAGVVAHFTIFKSKSEETLSAMQELNKEYSKTASAVKIYADALTRSQKGSNEYKAALEGLNNISIRYNSTLLTESSNLDEVSAKRKVLLGLIDQEYIKKKQIIDIDQATAKRDAALLPIREAIFESFRYIEGGAEKAALVYAKFIDVATNTEKRPSFAKQLSEETGISFKKMYDYLRDAAAAINGFRLAQERQSKYYPANVVGITFDEKSIEEAKKEFEEFEKLRKQGAEKLLDTKYVTEQSRTFKEWIENQIYLFEKIGDTSAVVKLRLALAELAKDEEKYNKSALKEQNDLFKAKEELAKKEIDLQKRLNDAIIAAMQEGSEKQYREVENRYKDRLLQVDENENEYLKALNESLGLKPTDKDYITKLPAEKQAQFDKERILEKEKYNNEVLKLDKQLLDKQQEIYDSVEERFMSDLEKRKLEIEKFYADKINALKDIYTIPTGKLDELTGNILFNPKELDQLKAYQSAVDQLIAKKNAEISAVNQEAAMKLSPLYQKAFGEIELYGSRTLAKLRDDIEKMLESARQVDVDGKTMIKVALPSFDDQGKKISDFTTMTIEEFIKWKNRLEDITKKTREGNPFSALSDSFNEMIDAIKSGDTTAISDAVKSFTSAAEGAVDMVGQWKQSLEPLLSEETSQQLDKVVSGIQGGINVASGIARFATGDIVGGITSTLKGIGQLFTAFSKNREITADQIHQYESLVKVIGEVIDKQMELLASLSGRDAVRASEEILRNIERSVDATRNMASEYLKSRSANEHSFGYKLREDLRPYVQQINALGIAWDGEAQSFIKLSAEQLKIIKTQLPEAWAQLDEKTQGYIDSIIDGTDSVERLKEALNEALTNLNFDSAKSSLQDLLLDADSTMQNVADNFENYMKKAIVNLVTSSILSVELRKWYDDFAQRMKDGILDKNDVESLRTEYTRIFNKGKALTEAAYSAAGLSTTIGVGGGISKAIQGVTEDTARRLEGLINSIRETSVINMGNTKQLVESSQAIQGYAAQSLGHLRNIDATTAAQLTLFNEVMATASGTGGKGLKVYIQQ